MDLNYNNLEIGTIIISTHNTSNGLKARPFVVMMTTGYSFREREYTVVPLCTSHGDHIVDESRYELRVMKSRHNNLNRNGYAKCHQLQTVSSSMIDSVIGSLEPWIVANIKEQYQKYCKKNNLQIFI